MTTSKGSGALWNYIKNIWKMNVEKIINSRKKSRKPFNSFSKIFTFMSIVVHLAYRRIRFLQNQNRCSLIRWIFEKKESGLYRKENPRNSRLYYLHLSLCSLTDRLICCILFIEYESSPKNNQKSFLNSSQEIHVTVFLPFVAWQNWCS